MDATLWLSPGGHQRQLPGSKTSGIEARSSGSFRECGRSATGRVRAVTTDLFRVGQIEGLLFGGKLGKRSVMSRPVAVVAER